MKLVENETCLITSHGFTGFPSEMDPLGNYLLEKNFVWKNLILPGHATTPEYLRDVTWQEWGNYVINEIQLLLENSRYNKVVMAGLSLGGLLTLYALEELPELSAGITLAAPIKIFNPFQAFLSKIPKLSFWIDGQRIGKVDINDPEAKKNHKSYSRFHSDNAKQLNSLANHVKKNLQKIKQPLLIIHSKNDELVPYKNAQNIYNRVVNTKNKEIFTVERSSHVLTRDYDHQIIFDKISSFVKKLE
ncbi:MAG: alpha/beta hydrolase [Candidatus Hodarchaeales archaeon]|jgi:carboxylesterase